MFENFPKNLLEFEDRFRTQEDCLGYLFTLRWPQGFVCPQCGHAGKAWSTNRELFVCPACRHQTSVTAGTIFHRTRKPLTLWFRAIWYITTHKHGGNALGLQRDLGLSYHTAWEWLHKLRQAMIRPGREPLSGLVEVDEAFIGGAKPGKAGRGAEGKAIIAVAVEDKDEAGFGRIRLQRIPDASSDSLLGFIQTHIAPESQIRTDGWRGYGKVAQNGYEHQVVIAKKQKEAGEDALPLCHRVISLFKRIWVSTFQGAIHPEHLDSYLEEFTFRFNRRKAKHRTLLAFRLLEYAVVCPPCPGEEHRAGVGTSVAPKAAPDRWPSGRQKAAPLGRCTTASRGRSPVLMGTDSSTLLRSSARSHWCPYRMCVTGNKSIRKHGALSPASARAGF